MEEVQAFTPLLISMPRLSMVLNGLIRITAPSPISSIGNTSNSPLPSDFIHPNGTASCGEPSTAYFMPGTLQSSVLIAADTKALSWRTGHFTEFPSQEATVLMQSPFFGGVVPEHIVLYEGACE